MISTSAAADNNPVSSGIGVSHSVAMILSLVCGGLSALAFAPFSVWPVLYFTVAVFFVLVYSATTRRRSSLIGYCFGLGQFGAGVYWIYFSLHLFGAAIAPLAALGALLFVMLLALFPALYANVAWRFRDAHGYWFLLAGPALWLLVEWMRSWIFTGFPWLSLGYSTIHSPLAGYAPIGGVFLGSLLLALCSGGLAYVFRRRSIGSSLLLLVLSGLVMGGGAKLRTVQWTEISGEPISVTMVQGNVAQELKFLPNLLEDSLEIYTSLSNTGADLVIWPESAIPTFFSDVEQWEAGFVAEAKARGSVVMSGGFLTNDDYSEYYNAIKVLGGTDDQVYTKRHLVPFGEFIPFRDILSLLSDLIMIPMSDLSAGSGPLKPIDVNGVKFGMSICFEDAFGGEMRGQFPDANILINVSNDAWFGDSTAPHQHQEVAAMRSLEFERSMLRVTNTGISSLISEKGIIVEQGPQFEATALTVDVAPRTGNTPFVWIGHKLAVGLAVLLLLGNWLLLQRGRSDAVQA